MYLLRHTIKVDYLIINLTIERLSRFNLRLRDMISSKSYEK